MLFTFLSTLQFVSSTMLRIKFQERRDLNPGLLGEKHKRYLCALLSPIFSSLPKKGLFTVLGPQQRHLFLRRPVHQCKPRLRLSRCLAPRRHGLPSPFGELRTGS